MHVHCAVDTPVEFGLVVLLQLTTLAENSAGGAAVNAGGIGRLIHGWVA